MSEAQFVSEEGLLFPVAVESLAEIFELLLASNQQKQQEGSYLLKDYVSSITCKGNYKELVNDIHKEISRSFQEPITVKYKTTAEGTQSPGVQISPTSVEAIAARLRAIMCICEVKLEDSSKIVQCFFQFLFSLLPLPSKQLSLLAAQAIDNVVAYASPRQARDIVAVFVDHFNAWIQSQSMWDRVSILYIVEQLTAGSNCDLLLPSWEAIFTDLLNLFFNEIDLEDPQNIRLLIVECICWLQRKFDRTNGKIGMLYEKLLASLAKHPASCLLLERALLICFYGNSFYSVQKHANLFAAFVGCYKKIRTKEPYYFSALSAFIEGTPDEFLGTFWTAFLPIVQKEFHVVPNEILACCCKFIQAIDRSDLNVKLIVVVLQEHLTMTKLYPNFIEFFRIVRQNFAHFAQNDQGLIVKLLSDIYSSNQIVFDTTCVDFCIECLQIHPFFKNKIHPFLLDIAGKILIAQTFSGVSLECIHNPLPSNDAEQMATAFYALHSLYGRIELKIDTKLQSFFKKITAFFIKKSFVLSTKIEAVKCLLKWETRLQDFEILHTILHQCINAESAQPDYKLAILRNIPENLDSLMANSKMSNLILLLCNDSCVQVQVEAFRMLKRITNVNPIPILPVVHQLAINHLFTLEYFDGQRQTRYSSFFLYLLVNILGKSSCPLIDSLFSGLLTKIDSRWIDVSVNSLKSLQHIYRTCGKKAQRHTFELVPRLFSIAADSDYRKRLEALKTLGDAFFYSTIAHSIWTQQPHLMPFLLELLRSKIPSLQINRQILRLLGLIGAVDPYKVKLSKKDFKLNDEQKDMRLIQTIAVPDSSASDDFYPVIVINSLIRIIQDITFPKVLRYEAYISCLRVFHRSSPKVMVHFEYLAAFLVDTIRNHKPLTSADMMIQACTELVLVGKEAVIPYLQDMTSFFIKNWTENPLFCETNLDFLHFIVAIKEAVHYEVTKYLNQFIPFLIRMLNAFVAGTASNSKYDVQDCVVQVVAAFGTLVVYLDDYLLSVIIPILDLLSNQKVAVPIKISILGFIDALHASVNLSRFWLPIWNACFPLFGKLESELEQQSFLLIRKLSERYSGKFPQFKSIIAEYPGSDNIQSAQYHVQLIPFKIHSDVINFNLEKIASDVTKGAWNEIPTGVKGDWDEWLKEFTIHLLLNSSSPALRISTGLAVKFTPFAKELFHAAFLSNWSPVHQQYQEEIVQVVERALINPHVPPEIIQSFLNLAEFVEHDEKELPIDYKTLGAFSSKSHAYAKALHYRELEYLNDPKPSTVEALLSINTQLQLPDAAAGILNHSQTVHSIELRENWYEKLHRWQEALKVYQEKLQATPNNDEAFIGLLRCKHVLGDWEDVFTLVQQKWPISSEQMQTTIAPLAAASAWSLSNWKELDVYLEYIKEETPEGCFFRAISFVHRENFQMAQVFIDRTRDSVAGDISGLLNESYNRAYNAMIRIQLLTELEEIVIYKTNEQERENIEKLWEERLANIQPNVDVWHRILKVRSLLFSHVKNLPAWLEFLALCRKQDRIFIGLNTLKNILAELNLDLSFLQSPSSYLSVDPRLVLTSIKFAWELEGKQTAIAHLKGFIDKMIERVNHSSSQTSTSGTISTEHAVLSKSFRTYGNWIAKYKNKGITKENMDDVLNSHFLSTKYDPSSFKAWHRWALTNFEVVSLIERKNDPELRAKLSVYLCNTVKGFLRAISLTQGQQDILQDVLRFVTILFKYGSNHEINQIITEGFSKISVEAWLQIIPQLIARIHAPSPHVRRLVHQILLNVARVHPQSLIYSLTVASKSQNPTRRAAALSLIDKMRGIHPVLVDQALIVSYELIRVSVLWHEMWHEGLEEASRRYFGDRNINGMFSVLNPLHQIMEKGPETPLEQSFVQMYGRELTEAREWCIKYHTSGNISDINQAWDLYYAVFREISKQILHFNVISLEQASPRLLELHNLELSVPGTYSPSNKDGLIQIHRVNPILLVIASKQRPRKVEIIGNDGMSYCYLLKGREDIRQDQRVMQFFSLVNNCLQVDLETSNRHLKIRTFPVIPLSPNSGLIGWVDNCDTLHSLIKHYRESHSILLNIEHRLMLQMAPDYDNLTGLQKIEVFECALQNTSGMDLAKIFWLRSRNSEQWLERRTLYIRSLAVMSIVGYVLGLGDRHPSNLLIDRGNGIVVHIDFGDCFEAAMMREKFPEKIPFRLTRMLLYAMEASGIEGSFRITCEHTMRVLRINRESLMAILEAFIYDPLVTSKINPAAKLADPLGAAGQSVFHSNGSPTSLLSRTWYYPTDAEIERDPENVNAKALQVVRRVSNKLSGRDFGSKSTPMDIQAQVQRLIDEATSVENLSQCYVGWCPFW